MHGPPLLKARPTRPLTLTMFTSLSRRSGLTRAWAEIKPSISKQQQWWSLVQSNAGARTSDVNSRGGRKQRPVKTPVWTTTPVSGGLCRLCACWQTVDVSFCTSSPLTPTSARFLNPKLLSVLRFCRVHEGTVLDLDESNCGNSLSVFHLVAWVPFHRFNLNPKKPLRITPPTWSYTPGFLRCTTSAVYWQTQSSLANVARDVLWKLRVRFFKLCPLRFHSHISQKLTYAHTHARTHTAALSYSQRNGGAALIAAALRCEEKKKSTPQASRPHGIISLCKQRAQRNTIHQAVTLTSFPSEGRK